MNGLPCPPPSAQGREEEVLGEGRMGMDGERGKERAAGFIGSSAMEASVESIPAFRGCSKEQKRLCPPVFGYLLGALFFHPGQVVLYAAVFLLVDSEQKGIA